MVRLINDVVVLTPPGSFEQVKKIAGCCERTEGNPGSSGLGRRRIPRRLLVTINLLHHPASWKGSAVRGACAVAANLVHHPDEPDGASVYSAALRLSGAVSYSCRT